MFSPSMRPVWLIGGSLALALALSACGNTKQVLGLDRQAPDEFTVVSRAPLAIPPQFSLRPPEPGAPRPQEGTAEMQARRALTGQQVQQAYLNAGLSPGEATLLSKTGAVQAPDDIRQVVNREASTLADEQRGLTERLVFWREATPPGDVVDPDAEQRRIRENQALGEPVTRGETPKIERREKAFLEGLF